ncbi:MAG: 3-phosphoshikimate 1-carboxyvinyltransferase [Candidatus Omnitrophota bacterium]
MHTIKPLFNINKTITVPPDKSISHRAVILSSLCESETKIKNFLQSEDTRATLECMKKLGVKVAVKKGELLITGCGMFFNPKGKSPLELSAANSGTTMRILSGLLVSQKFPITFYALAQLSNRPMARIINPLSKMGADISGTAGTDKTSAGEDIYPPLNIKPVKKIKSAEFKLEIASAQVKSAIMLAALYANAETKIIEPFKSRDHTERMFRQFGANVKVKDKTIVCEPVKKLVSPKELIIPGDFSSAAFFIVLGLILKNSVLTIRKVNINPTRCGLLNVLERMGASIEIKNKKDEYEPYADIIVKSSKLKATMVEPSEIPSMIDEIPVLCVAAAFAEGKTEINGVKELKVKETDRVNSIIDNLLLSKVDIWEEHYNKSDSKIIINGGGSYEASSRFQSFRDHRTAMSMIVFAAALNNASVIDDVSCIDKSFPEFISLVNSLHK